MANIAAYHQLQQLAQFNYPASFASIDQIAQPQIPHIGESVPRKIDGSLQYTSSLTPLQTRKTLAITGLVLFLLATAGVIAAAILLRNPLIYFALFGTGAGVIGSIIATFHYFERVDFDSPQARQEETVMIRTHQLTLSQINQRYGNFDRAAAYELMGNAPEASYKQVAHLCLKQAEAEFIYQNHLARVESAYQRAIGPARRAYDRARNYESMATVNTLSAPRGHRVIPVLISLDAAYERGRASAELEYTERHIRPIYRRALHNLQVAYRSIQSSLASTYRQVPL
jgi:hypothetical protein